MGRGRGKGKKQLIIAARDNTGSGEDEKLPVRRRGRPLKLLKEDIKEEDGVETIEEDDVDIKSSVLIKKRKRASLVKDTEDLVVKEEIAPTEIIKNVGYRQNGSRRKNKPRRAAEVGVECI